MKKIIMMLLAIFQVNTGFSQSECGGGTYEPNPIVVPQNLPSFPGGANTCYTIPVAFHFNRTSTGIINEIPNFNMLQESNNIIQYLNAQFNGYNIYFELSESFVYNFQQYYDVLQGTGGATNTNPYCSVSPTCLINNFYDDVKVDDAYNIMFFSDYIPVSLIGEPAVIQTFGGAAFNGVGESGMLCKYAERNSPILIHEIGHTLGLWHTHRGTRIDITDPNNPGYPSAVIEGNHGACEDFGTGLGTNCVDCGDKCCDTPLDPNLFYNSDANCNYTGPTQFNPSLVNYMSYIKADCRSEFTPDQVTRMHYYLDTKDWLTDITSLSYFDLAIKDNETDDLTEPNWSTLVYDNGPDIWVRNNNLGDPESHQNPLFNHPIYGDPTVNIRIYNNGCAASTGNETLTVYWASPSTWQGWPDNWTGPANPFEKGEVGTMNIDAIEPGESVVVSMPWNASSMPSIPAGASISSCLLAKIDGGLNDPLHSEPYDLWIYNNNVALRNLTVINYAQIINFDENEPYDYAGDVGFIKGFVIENIEDVPGQFDFDLITDHLLLQEAEVYYTLPVELYTHIMNAMPINGVIPHKSLTNTILITNPTVTLEGFTLKENERLKVSPGINFLRSEVIHDNFKFRFSQRRHGNASILGSEHYEIRRTARAMFEAKSGSNVKVLKGQDVNLLAEDIGEDAQYNWFDNESNLLYTGKNITLTAEESKELQLEVITNSDKYKDYDSKNITVTDGIICNISPNPVNTNADVCVELSEGTTSGVLMLYSVNHNVVNNYIVTGSGETHLNLDLSNLNTGTYQAVLVIDGIISDIQYIIKQ